MVELRLLGLALTLLSHLLEKPALVLPCTSRHFRSRAHMP